MASISMGAQDSEDVPHKLVPSVSTVKSNVSKSSLSDKPDEDLELVQLAQGGDTRAFDQLVLKHSPKLYGLVYHMTLNKDDTSDLLQDIFAKAYRSINSFRGKSMFYTWIYSIAVNMTLNFLKKRKRKAATSFDELEVGIYQDPAFVDTSCRSNPRRQVNVQELQKKLNEAIMSLSKNHRMVVVMFDIQGMPHLEISKILKISEGTVRSRLFYAHQHLKSLLSEFDHFGEEH